jgi:hypothetical protein
LTGTDAYYKIYGANAFEAIVIEDTVGNTGEVEVNITWIDKKAPTATVEYTPNSATNNEVTATLTVSESILKPDGWEGPATGTIFTKRYTTDTTETVEFKDLVGNAGTKEINITRIDKSVIV